MTALIIFYTVIVVVILASLIINAINIVRLHREWKHRQDRSR